MSKIPTYIFAVLYTRTYDVLYMQYISFCVYITYVHMYVKINMKN